MSIQVFVDSDVIVSSLLSNTGAAFLLLHKIQKVDFYISTISQKELQRVAEELNIAKNSLILLIKNRLKVIKITKNIEVIKKNYQEYLLDANDAHIVAGALEGKVKFLLTYNLRHYLIHKIEKDFGIIVMTPGIFLQYLRSIEN